MKQIALSVDQMKHLKELGVDCNSASMEWVEIPTAESILNNGKECECILVCRIDDNDSTPAFLLQDIIEILPEHINGFDLICYTNNIQYYFDYYNRPRIFHKESEGSILDNAYAMLVWCAKRGYLKQK